MRTALATAGSVQEWITCAVAPSPSDGQRSPEVQRSGAHATARTFIVPSGSSERGVMDESGGAVRGLGECGAHGAGECGRSERRGSRSCAYEGAVDEELCRTR